MTMSRDVACQQLVELITDYLEGALTPDEVVAVEAHLAECDFCQRYLDQIRVTIETLGTIELPPLADDALEQLLAVFRGGTR